MRAQTDVHADSLLIGCRTCTQNSSRPPLLLAQSQRRQLTFSFTMRLKSENLALCKEVMRATQTHLRADGCAKENRSSADGAAETEIGWLV